MADISLVLKPDFGAAQKALAEIAASSTTAAERFQQFNDKMRDKSADDFIAKQKALQAALTVTRGETAGAQKAYDNYRKEIERLIQKGLDPQSEYIQRLSQEMQALEHDTENLTRANKDFVRDAAEGQEIIAGFAKAAAVAGAAVIGLIAAYTDGTYAGKLLEDSVNNLKDKVGQLVEPIVDKVVPAIADIINGIADFITGSHEMQGELEILAGFVLTAAAAFTAFFIVINQVKIMAAVTTAIQGITTAVKAMSAAIAANPIGLVVVIVIALIGVLITLVKNWDTVKLKVREFADSATTWLAETATKLQLNFSVAINNVKQFFLSLAAVITDKLLGAIANLLNALAEIPFIGDTFKSAADAVSGFNEGLQEGIEAAQRESEETERLARIRLAEIAAEKEARRLAHEQAKRNAQEEYEQNKADWEAEQTEAENKTTPGTTGNADSSSIEEDYEWRIDAEQEFQDALQALLDKEAAENKARLVKQEAARDKELAAERAHQQEMYNIRQAAFNAAASLIGSLGELMTDDTDSKKAFDQNKAIAAATAGLNTALAFTQALTDPSQPITALRIASAAAMLAAGIVQQKKILSASYRSAPSISVPNKQTSTTSAGTQTPQASSAGSVAGQSIVVQLDKRVLFSTMNEGLSDGLIKTKRS